MQDNIGCAHLQPTERGIFEDLMEMLACGHDGKSAFKVFKAFMAFLDQVDKPWSAPIPTNWAKLYYRQSPPFSIIGPYLNRLIIHLSGNNGELWINALSSFMHQDNARLWPNVRGLGGKIPLLKFAEEVVLSSDKDFTANYFVEKEMTGPEYSLLFQQAFLLSELCVYDQKKNLQVYNLAEDTPLHEIAKIID
jgi:hypothetical protein